MFFEADRSKEAIKQRMLKVAYNQWQINDRTELDPLVNILMDALSAELYDVVNDIKTAEGRILEKMAHLLAPDLLIMPMPAHAVMQALPAETTDIIDSDAQFYTTKRIASRPDGPLDTPLDMYFAPLKKTRIFNADLAYLYVPGNLYNFDRTSNKVLAASGRDNSSKGECVAYIGLNANTVIADLHGMTFYFDPKNMEAAATNILYQYLPNTTWYLGSKKLSTASGLRDYVPVVPPRETEKKDQPYENTMQTIAENLTGYYRPRFFTITDDFSIKDEHFQYYPEVFSGIFPAQTLTSFQQKMLWLKIVFPVSIKEEILNALHVSINVFPVFNCRKNDLRYRLRGGRHIIPIPNVVNENFLAVKSFTDGEIEYRQEAVKNPSGKETGTYTLKTGGLERFDSRNGREMILYLVELLRSESSAFSVYGQDFIAGVLNDFNKLIALLEQRVNMQLAEAIETPNYMIVSPEKNHDLMFVEYWTTNADLANNLRLGTRLFQSSGASVRADSLVLLTGTLGGKAKLKNDEKLVAFKYGLLTHDRIVTVEDIRSFCFHELGNRLRDVVVQRGFAVSENMKEGIKRTLDVMLTPAQNANDTEEWKELCSNIKLKLQSRSGMTYNYRVFTA